MYIYVISTFSSTGLVLGLPSVSYWLSLVTVFVLKVVVTSDCECVSLLATPWEEINAGGYVNKTKNVCSI